MTVKRESALPKRGYVSPLRQQQAQATAQRIVEAAQRLFVTRGFVGTAVADVAREAGVAERTVYATFSSKRALLFACVDAAIAGDSGPTRVADREWFRHVIDEPDPRRKVDLLAGAVRAIHERTALMFRVVKEAAAVDPSVAETLARHRVGQEEDEGRVVDAFGEGAFRPGLTREDALETVWVLTTPDFYAQAVERGWSPNQFEHWLSDALARCLLR